MYITTFRVHCSVCVFHYGFEQTEESGVYEGTDCYKKLTAHKYIFNVSVEVFAEAACILLHKGVHVGLNGGISECDELHEYCKEYRYGKSQV